MSKISKLMIFIPVILLMVLVGACTTASTLPSTPTPTATPTIQPTTTPRGTPLSALPSVADVVAKVMPAVAYVSVEYKVASIFLATKSGSGVVLSPDGYILTNNHVIEGYTKIEVFLPNDEQTYQASVVGADPTSDLAVIKIDGHNFPTAQFGDPSGLRDGDWVIALGNALGLVEGGPTVTLGIVSNLERSFPPSAANQSAYYDIIQTDAAINPGNSGGPLVDLEGKVVGVNTFIASGAENIGFAIGANTASRVYDDLVKYGRVIRPYLGATFNDLTPDVASQLGISISRGVLVSYVVPGGPVAKAGIQANDVVTSFQDQKVTAASALIKLLWEYKVGDNAKITYWRGNSEHVVSVTLGERP